MSLRPRKTLTQSRGHRIVTAPAVEPISLDYAREIIRTPPPEDDALIVDCIAQARAMFEAATAIACITQTWKLTLDNWPQQRDMWWDGVQQMAVTELYTGGSGPATVTLPRFPLQTVDTVATYSQGNVESLATVASVFFTDTESFPGRLMLGSGQVWPTALRDHNAVGITYTAGFGATPAAVPFVLRRAIANATAYLYENRGTGCSSGAVLAQSGALQLAAEYASINI